MSAGTAFRPVSNDERYHIPPSIVSLHSRYHSPREREDMNRKPGLRSENGRDSCGRRPRGKDVVHQQYCGIPAVRGLARGLPEHRPPPWIHCEGSSKIAQPIRLSQALLMPRTRGLRGKFAAGKHGRAASQPPRQDLGLVVTSRALIRSVCGHPRDKQIVRRRDRGHVFGERRPGQIGHQTTQDRLPTELELGHEPAHHSFMPKAAARATVDELLFHTDRTATGDQRP